MKRFLLTATLAVFLAHSSFAQTQIAAPAGWKTQTKANGATTYTPPDLRAGERYSVTIYDAAPLDGKTPEAYLRGFAGPVGTGAGKLRAPLKIQTHEGGITSGVGTYVGPNGTALSVVFIGVSLDGAGMDVTRILLSGDAVLKRYAASQSEIVLSMVRRAADAKAESQNSAAPVPRFAAPVMASVGGALVPGVYAGEHFRDGELRDRYRIYIYQNGEYRICDENDRDVTLRALYTVSSGLGNVVYERSTGKINIGEFMENHPSDDEQTFCLYGRDSAGKPLIYQYTPDLFWRIYPDKPGDFKLFRWVGPPTKRPSPSAESGRKADQIAARQAKADAERAKIAQAERRKFAVAPGKGVQNAQIAVILYEFVYGTIQSTSREYLLLKDGTICEELPRVALDEFNVPASKRLEPQKWGRWRRVKDEYQASWGGKPFEALKGEAVLPAPPGFRLAGHYEGGSGFSSYGSSSWTSWGTTFDKTGRFRDDAWESNSSTSTGNSSSTTHTDENGTDTLASGRIGFDGSGWVTQSDENGSSTMMQGSTLSGQPSFIYNGGTSNPTPKKRSTKPKPSKVGTYSFDGYTLTLRYSDGRIERTPAFFLSDKRESLWQGGSVMFLEKPKTK